MPCLKVEITCLKDDCSFVILMMLLSRDVAGGAVIVEEAGGQVFDP